MNMDYSKAFELLNQDAEKERNRKAEKAVHDNLYNKGFRDGLAVLDKIRAEIEKAVWEDVVVGLDGTDEVRIPRLEPDDVFEIIDKYKAETESEDGQ